MSSPQNRRTERGWGNGTKTEESGNPLWSIDRCSSGAFDVFRPSKQVEPQPEASVRDPSVRDPSVCRHRWLGKSALPHESWSVEPAHYSGLPGPRLRRLCASSLALRGNRYMVLGSNETPPRIPLPTFVQRAVRRCPTTAASGRCRGEQEVVARSPSMETARGGNCDAERGAAHGWVGGLRTERRTTEAS